MKANFFTLDALLASALIMSAIIIATVQMNSDVYTTDIEYMAADTMKVLNTLEMNEINKTLLDKLMDNGNITNLDMNTSVMVMIGTFWAEGNSEIAKQIAETVLEGAIPPSYSYGLWVQNDPIKLVNNTKPEDLVQYRKFVSGIAQGKTIRGYVSKIYFSDISSKRTNGFVYFGGYVGQGNLTFKIGLPDNVTIINATLEIDPASNFNLTINGLNAGYYNKGTGGGGYMQADYFSLNTYKNYFNGGNNTFRIIFDHPQLNYISGGYLQITYETPYKADIGTSYVNGSATKTFNLPGIEGIINLYDSLYIPGNLDGMQLNVDYYSNYTTYMTIGGTQIFRNTTHGNHSIRLNNSQIKSIFSAENISYLSISNTTLPIKFGLEGVEYSGITGKTDTVLATDVSGSMEWYSNPIAPIQYGSYNSTSFVKLDEFMVSNVNQIEFKVDSTADWLGGTLTNTTESGGSVMLDTGGELTEKLDSSQTTSTVGPSFYDQKYKGQTFTPTVSGNLTKVALYLYKYRNPPGVVVEIQDVTGGLPNGNVLATATRNDITKWVYDEYDFSFSSHPHLTSGTQYAIVVYVGGSGGSGSKFYKIGRSSSSSSYSDGSYVYSEDFGSTWSTYNADAYFKVYLEAPGYQHNGYVMNSFDTGETSYWKAFQSNDTTPAGTSITAEFQSSNDTSTWSDWDTDITDVPEGRYIRQRLNMTSDGTDTPIVDSTIIFASNESNGTAYDTFDVVMQFTSQTYQANTGRLRLKSPSGLWYGDGLGGSGVQEVSYERAEYIRILPSAFEEGKWEAWAKVTNGKNTDYNLVEQWPDERIDVAKEGDVLFVNTVLNNSGNRMGLVSYNDQVENYDALTNLSSPLINRISTYTPGGGTCICCGVNRAVNLLPTNGTRFIVLISDGDANYECSSFIDYKGSKDYDNGPQSAIESGENACNNGIRVFTVGFGPQLSEVGTSTLKNMTCNISDYHNAQNAEELLMILNNISKEILTISYTKQSVNITGNFSKTTLYSTSYIKINYSGIPDPEDYGEIIVNYEGQRFNNSVSNGTLFIPDNTELLEAKVSSYSADLWTSNVTINEEGKNNYTDVFRLSDFGSQFTDLGDPFLVNIPLNEIKRNVNNTVTVKTGITPVNISNGSIDDRMFYKLIIKNFAQSPVVGNTAKGCEWYLEFEDGTSTYLKIPTSYTGSDICYYGNATYNENDSVDMAAYDLFSQLDLKGNGTLAVKIDEDTLVAQLATVGNVPSMVGPSMISFKIWK